MTDEHKSHPASEHKLTESRKKGQVQKSLELNLWLFSLLTLIYLWLFAAEIGRDVQKLFIEVLKFVSFMRAETDLSGIYHVFISGTVAIFLPFFVYMTFVAVVVNVFQVGLHWSTEPLTPKFSQLNPMQGLKKIASKKNMFEVVKAILTLVTLALFVLAVAETLWLQLVQTAQTGSWQQITGEFGRQCFLLALYLLLAKIPLLLLDIWFSRWDFNKKMMMSSREVKEEYKKKEGDPLVKSKRKQQQKDFAKKVMSLTAIRGADLVVNNPVHVSVVLKFDVQTMIAPQVVASGRGLLAAVIRKLARRHGLPEVTDIPLARGLYKDVAIGQAVPKQYFSALAPAYARILPHYVTQKSEQHHA
jgi:flagellar biosynthesis protein FlhB